MALKKFRHILGDRVDFSQCVATFLVGFKTHGGL